MVKGERKIEIGEYIISEDIMDGKKRIIENESVKLRREEGENIQEVENEENKKEGREKKKEDGEKDKDEMKKVEG